MFHPLSSHLQHQLHRTGARSIHMSERGHGASAAPQRPEANRRQIANHRAEKSDLVQELPEVSPMRAIGVLCLSCDRLFPVVPTGRTFMPRHGSGGGMASDSRGMKRTTVIQAVDVPDACIRASYVSRDVIEQRNPNRYHTFARADHPRRDGLTKHLASCCPGASRQLVRYISPLNSSSSSSLSLFFIFLSVFYISFPLDNCSRRPPDRAPTAR